MSTHFTYEIDERKLRVKLKELESPMSSDAWQSFELYSNLQSRHYSAGSFKNVQFPLNRNVIVPAIFAVLIVFFSFLLFNFINIKNPSAAAEETGNTNIVIPTAEVKPVTNEPVPVGASEKLPATTNNKDAIKEAETNIVKENKATIQNKVPPAGGSGISNAGSQGSASSSPARTPLVASTTSSNSNTVKPTTVVAINTTTPSNSLATDADQATKKKRKRRAVEVVETDSSSDSRPSLGNEERESEERPN